MKQGEYTVFIPVFRFAVSDKSFLPKPQTLYYCSYGRILAGMGAVFVAFKRNEIYWVYFCFIPADTRITLGGMRLHQDIDNERPMAQNE